jgi:hypothetical protein
MAMCWEDESDTVAKIVRILGMITWFHGDALYGGECIQMEKLDDVRHGRCAEERLCAECADKVVGREAFKAGDRCCRGEIMRMINRHVGRVICMDANGKRRGKVEEVLGVASRCYNS